MKALKSKTIDFNALAGTLYVVAKGFGYEVPPELIVGVLTVGNVILRYFTTKAMSEK